jgi:hypothetical protein
MPIAGASVAAPVQALVAASNVAAGTSAAAPVQAPVDAYVAAGASDAATVQAPVAWDPYEPVSYVAPENPYDTSIVDDEPEVTLCSLVLIPFNPFVLDLALLG